MPNDTTETLNFLRKARTAAFLTLDQLAARTEKLEQQDNELFTHVSRSTIANLESGRSKKPRPRTAITLATALQVSIDSLFPNGLDDGNRLIDFSAE